MLRTMSSKNGKASVVVRQLSIAFGRSERNNMLKVGELTMLLLSRRAHVFFETPNWLIIVIMNLLCPMYTVCHK